MIASELNLELGTAPNVLTTNKRKTAHANMEYSDYLLQNRFIRKYNKIIEVGAFKFVS